MSSNGGLRVGIVGATGQVGVAMRSILLERAAFNSIGPAADVRFFEALSDAGVNIEMISTSEIRVSVVVSETQVQDAVNAAHAAFDLGSDEVEAVVYGGTGR